MAKKGLGNALFPKALPAGAAGTLSIDNRKTAQTKALLKAPAARFIS
jgi:hypothetical protein